MQNQYKLATDLLIKLIMMVQNSNQLNFLTGKLSGRICQKARQKDIIEFIASSKIESENSFEWRKIMRPEYNVNEDQF